MFLFIINQKSHTDHVVMLVGKKWFLVYIGELIVSESGPSQQSVRRGGPEHLHTTASLFPVQTATTG